MSRESKQFLTFLLVVFAVLFALLVWPTHFAYFPSPDSRYPLVRVNRITRVVEVCRWSDGWVPVYEPESEPMSEQYDFEHGPKGR